MSPPVSPRQRDIGEVASLRAEGVAPQPHSGFSAKIGKTATLMLTEPLRLRHLPYPRYRAAEEDIATHPSHTHKLHNMFVQLHSLLTFPDCRNRGMTNPYKKERHPMQKSLRCRLVCGRLSRYKATLNVCPFTRTI